MDWSLLILRIRASGMTYREIAERVQVSHSTIEHLVYGLTKEPGHALGERLIQLSQDSSQRSAV